MFDLRGAISQQVDASAHTAKYTKEYFIETEMVVLDWLEKSMDMNCIENALGDAYVRHIQR